MSGAPTPSWQPTLDLALARYAALTLRWCETGGVPPYPAAFLAGWFASACFAVQPWPENFNESFQAGWDEAQLCREIYDREVRS